MLTEDHFIIVNTDLDATLLDHDTYSWRPASEALALLKKHEIPLILNSSKTLAEMKSLASELKVNYPLVCENGSVIAIPQDGELSKNHILSHAESLEEEENYWICYLGQNRAQVLEQVTMMRAKNAAFDFQGYADWTVKQVAEHTGLTLEKAALSLQRSGTEPIHWHGTEDSFEKFSSQLIKKSLKCVSGGRFIHLSGNSDKANGLQKVSAIYQDKYPQRKITTIALGDSPNDLGMLNAADIAVVIPNKVELSPTAAHVIHAKKHGPSGWNTSILEILQAR